MFINNDMTLITVSLVHSAHSKRQLLHSSIMTVTLLECFGGYRGGSPTAVQA